MFHLIQVVHVDSERVAAVFKLLAWAVVLWLAWNWLSDDQPAVNAMLGHALGAVYAPFAGVFAAIGSTLRFVVTALSVLLPVWALAVGCGMGLSGPEHQSEFWLVIAAVEAVCILLLGYPLLAGMVAAGSIAAVRAAIVTRTPLRGGTEWLPAFVVLGLSAWGSTRYGLVLSPVCWLLVPASWICLTLGTAWGTYRDGWSGDRGPLRLLLLAAALTMAAAGPFGVEAARTAALLPGMLPTAPALTAPAVAGNIPLDRDVGAAALPARQSGGAGAPRGSTQGAKPQSASPTVRPRT